MENKEGRFEVPFISGNLDIEKKSLGCLIVEDLTISDSKIIGMLKERARVLKAFKGKAVGSKQEELAILFSYDEDDADILDPVYQLGDIATEK